MDNKNMQVQIANYQILKKASLEFIPGLNVIVGPSNNGKSSILKAIKALIFTVPGTTPIRSGQSNYTVGIQYNNHIIILQKGLKESMYMVDKEKYSKFGQTTPEIVSNSLNIKELELSGNKVQLNFWDQMNYPFLLDKSAVDMFKFVVDTGENDKLSTALKTMVSDRQSINKTVDMIQGSINTIDLEIEEYNKQLEEAKFIVEASLGIITLQPQVAKYNLLKDLKNRRDKLLADKGLNKTEFDKALLKLTSLTSISKSINSIVAKKETLTNYLVKLHGLIGDLADIQEELNHLERYKLNLTQSHQVLFELKEIFEKINYISKQKKCLKMSPTVKLNFNRDDIMKIIELKSLKIKHEEINYSEVEIETNKIALKSSYELYKELKNNFKICPYCGNPIHD